MTRGLTLNLTRGQVAGRAMSMIAATPANAGPPKPIAYRLEGGYNGGFDPMAEHCASWSFGNRTPTSDCIGLALWSSGIDRLQPGYKGTRGEWLNCASLMDDSLGLRKYCRPLKTTESALPGDWLLTRDHIGVIIRPESGEAWEDGDHLVVDCSPRHGRATAVNTGYPWSDNCVVVRPKFYKED